jgi:hypothetical protein
MVDSMKAALLYEPDVHDAGLSADVSPNDDLVQDLLDAMHWRLATTAN